MKLTFVDTGVPVDGLHDFEFVKRNRAVPAGAGLSWVPVTAVRGPLEAASVAVEEVPGSHRT